MVEHNQQWENISALMDEEISSDDEMCQSINWLFQDPVCQQKWQDYHRIGMWMDSQAFRELRQEQQKEILVSRSLLSLRNRRLNLSFAAMMLAIGVGLSVYSIQSSSFQPNGDMLLTSLSQGNAKEFASKLFIDGNATASNDAEKAQESSVEDSENKPGLNQDEVAI